MANITLLGASYTDVPAVDLPKTGGGTVRFYENGGGGGGMTVTGTVVGNGTNVLQIPCEFEPDLIRIQGDLSEDVATRGIVFLTIIKDMDIYYGLDSSTSASITNIFAIPNITGYNESDTSDIHATYSSGTLSVDTVQHSGSKRWPSGITYSYKLIKFG